MKHLVAEKKSNEFQMLNRAVEIDAQTEKMKEMNQELCLDMEGFRQFRDINHCVLIFNCMYARFIFLKIMNIFKIKFSFLFTLIVGMDLAYWHSSKDLMKVENMPYHTKSLLNFLDSPKFPHLLKILVNSKLLEEVNQKAFHLRDFLLRSLDHASLLSL